MVEREDGLYLAVIYIMTVVTFYHVNTYLNTIISYVLYSSH
jgi:hypothetical protein